MKNAILACKFIVSVVVCLLATQLMLFVPFASADFADGLILHHSYDEGSGAHAADLSGNGHDGVIDNPQWVAGKFGNALYFGGAGSEMFVTVTSTPLLNVNECTFMAWVNAEHWDGTRQIVGKSVHGGCSGRTQYGLFSEGGTFKLRFETSGGRADINADLPPTGEWVHVAFTNDGSTAILYVNGASVMEGEIPGELNANEDPWRIAQDCDRPNNVFAGAIDEVRLWDRALSASDIAILKDMPTAVEAQAKLATTWGDIKSDR